MLTDVWAGSVVEALVEVSAMMLLMNISVPLVIGEFTNALVVELTNIRLSIGALVCAETIVCADAVIEIDMSTVVREAGDVDVMIDALPRILVDALASIKVEMWSDEVNINLPGAAITVLDFTLIV